MDCIYKFRLSECYRNVRSAPTAAIHYYLSYETNGRRSEASEDKGTRGVEIRMENLSDFGNTTKKLYHQQVDDRFQPHKA